MPVTKPTVLPEFATGVSGTEPTVGEKSSGWLVNQKPPAQKMNWLHKHTYNWLLWLQDITNQAFTWTANHIFSGNVSVGGTLGVTGTANLNGAANVGGALDVNGNSDLAGVITLSGANPAATTAHTNKLTPKNVCKGWAQVATGYESDSPAPKLLDGFNVASVHYGVGGDTLIVTFATAIAAALTYTNNAAVSRTVYRGAVVASVDYGQLICTAQWLSSTEVQVLVNNGLDVSSAVVVGTTPNVFSIFVFGAQ